MTKLYPYIPIICFVFGLAVGIVVTIIGFRLGFSSSYEIRESKEYPLAEGCGLFPSKKDPAEFELLEDDKN